MPSTKEKFLDPATGPPPPSYLEPRCEINEQVIDAGGDRARRRGMVKAPDGGRVADEVIDELVAGAQTE
jgi:hypothetical protein